MSEPTAASMERARAARAKCRCETFPLRLVCDKHIALALDAERARGERLAEAARKLRLKCVLLCPCPSFKGSTRHVADCAAAAFDTVLRNWEVGR